MQIKFVLAAGKWLKSYPLTQTLCYFPVANTNYYFLESLHVIIKIVLINMNV